MQRPNILGLSVTGDVLVMKGGLQGYNVVNLTTIF